MYLQNHEQHKKSGYLLLIILLISILSVYAVHDSASILSGYISTYETKPATFNFKVSSDISSTEDILNITLFTQGVSLLKVNNPSASWRHENSSDAINWTGIISTDGSQGFNFNSALNKVTADKTYNWNVETVDTNGDKDTSSILVTVLNDAVNPSITVNFPVNYGFVKNETFQINM